MLDKSTSPTNPKTNTQKTIKSNSKLHPIFGIIATKQIQTELPKGLVNPSNSLLDQHKPRKITVKLGVIKQETLNTNTDQLLSLDEEVRERMKRTKDGKPRLKRISKEGHFNCGRWQQEEHEKFIEAIMKYGNEWKMVQKHVGSRSSTQARSHAQKFFVKMKKSCIDLDIDLSNNSIQSLHNFATTLTPEEYKNIISALNNVAFEKKGHKKSCDSSLEPKQKRRGIHRLGFRKQTDILKFTEDLIINEIQEGYTNSACLSTTTSSLYTKTIPIRNEKGDLFNNFNVEMKTIFDLKGESLKKKRLRGGSIESLMQFLPTVENKQSLDENDYNFIKSFNSSFNSSLSSSFKRHSSEDFSIKSEYGNFLNVYGQNECNDITVFFNDEKEQIEFTSNDFPINKSNKPNFSFMNSNSDLDELFGSLN